MPTPFGVQPNPGTDNNTVASIDSAGNEILSGNLTVGKTVVLDKITTTPPATTNALTLYTTDGQTLSTVGSNGSASTQPGSVAWVNVKAAPFFAKGDGVTDDTAAINAAIASITSAQGGVVYFPSGIYEVSSPIQPIRGGIRLLGDHSVNDGFEGGFTNDTVIDATAGFSGTAIVSSNGQGDFSMRDITVRGHNMTVGTTIGINATSSTLLEDVVVSFTVGDGIHISGDACWMRNVGVFHAGNSTNVGYGFVINQADSAYIGCLASGCASAGWRVQAADNSTFTACRAEDGPLGTGSQGFLVQVAGSFGGISFNQCSTDLNDGDGFVVSSATGNGCIQLNGCEFRRDGNNNGTGGGGFSGIKIINSSLPVIIDGTTVTARQGDHGGTDAPVNSLTITNSTFVSLNGGFLGYASGGKAVNWDGTGTFLMGTNVLTSSVATSSQTLQTSVPFSGYSATPVDQNLLAWTYDPILQTASSTLTSGTVYMIRVQLFRPCSVTNVIVEVVTNGSGLVSGQNLAGLYNASGTLLATTADQSTAWTSTGAKTMALVGGPFYLAPGYYYVALLSNGTTPAFGRATTQGASAINVGLTAATSRYATGPVGQIGLPNNVTMGSLAQLANSHWAALS